MEHLHSVVQIILATLNFRIDMIAGNPPQPELVYYSGDRKSVV